MISTKTLLPCSLTDSQTLGIRMWTSFSSVPLLSHVQLFATPWNTACQASLSITNSRSLPKPMSIESLMPSNHFILCHSLLLLPSIYPSIGVFSNESALRIRWPKFQLQHQPFQWTSLESYYSTYHNLLSARETFVSVLHKKYIHLFKSSFKVSAFHIINSKSKNLIQISQARKSQISSLKLSVLEIGWHSV